MADLQCKEGSQETLVTLIGLVSGIYFAQIANNKLTTIWTAFIALTLLHVYANYQGVRCLQLRTLNPTRTELLIHHYYNSQPLTPQSIAQDEPILSNLPWSAGVEIGGRWPDGFKCRDTVAGGRVRVGIDSKQVVHVLLHSEADQRDQMIGFFTACCLDPRMSRILRGSSGQEGEMFVDRIERHGWDMSQLCLGTKSWRYEWSL